MVCAAILILILGGCGKRASSTKNTGPTQNVSPTTTGPGTPAAPPKDGTPAGGGLPILGDTYGKVLKASQRVTEILNGVTDDASARSAAPQLRQAAGELGAATKQLKQTVAAYDLAGQKAQLNQFYQNLGEQGDETGIQLRNAIERVGTAPYYPSIKAEVGAVLDAMIENNSIKGREAMQKWIQDKKLR
jgi:hypothetical protein